jgi:hypothetical protein
MMLLSNAVEIKYDFHTEFTETAIFALAFLINT